MTINTAAASVTVTQGNSTTLFRCEVHPSDIKQQQQNDDVATNLSSNPHTNALNLLKEIQGKTSDFLNDLVKQQNQQQQNDGNNNRRGRGLNENAEDDESDSEME